MKLHIGPKESTYVALEDVAQLKWKRLRTERRPIGLQCQP
jgi:hypothetical protein